MADDCLFCKILEGTIPAKEVLSTETTFAFEDIDPKAPTHVLVVPRQHVRDASVLRPEHGSVLADMLASAQAVAELRGLDGGYRLVFNVGDDAGNSVPHLHLHVL